MSTLLLNHAAINEAAAGLSGADRAALEHHVGAESQGPVTPHNVAALCALLRVDFAEICRLSPDARGRG